MTQIWKVIYVASRFEKKVASFLEKEGYTYYLPLIEKIRVWSDRKKKVLMPLFNGYVFVQPKERERDKILQFPGVVKFLRYNGVDAFVTEKELELIQSIVEKGYDISQYNDDEIFTPGEAVAVTQGPLKGFSGEILRIGNDNFALIVFENFGQSVKVKLPKQIIKKIA
ncbi:MAG: UpxY family transcription antiterminator [Bacteroidetes bacterium]|nr:UpxY family transcription antiterminator [Bacteroidota bacterium]